MSFDNSKCYKRLIDKVSQKHYFLYKTALYFAHMGLFVEFSLKKK